MTDPSGPQDDGGTELAEEEREGLIPSYITLRSELNEAEQANILDAEEWAFARKRNLLDEKLLKNLHKKMYGNVWMWAGDYRTSGKNIGIDAYLIPTELRQLLTIAATGSRTGSTNLMKLRPTFITGWCRYIATQTATVDMRVLLPIFFSNRWARNDLAGAERTWLISMKPENAILMPCKTPMGTT